MERYTVKHQLDNQRTELKYVVPVSLFDSFMTYANSRGFVEIYEERKVSSIYFDNLSNSNLTDSLDGVSKRIKTRVRWYSNDDRVQQENKIKINNLGFKEVEYLNLSGSVLESIVNDNCDFYLIFDYPLCPVSYVSYSRRYFFNNLSDTRITFDYNLEAKDFETFTQRQLDSMFVIEVKYSKESQVLFPASLFSKKFSKYQFSRIGMID
jgi:hypothetical protein